VFLRHDQTSFRDPKVFGPRIVSLSTSITAMPGSGNLPPSSGPLPAYANCRHDRTGACGSCNIVPGHRILHTPFANSRGNARDRILVSAPTPGCLSHCREAAKFADGIGDPLHAPHPSD
jgi:hypothetical protein